MLQISFGHLKCNDLFIHFAMEAIALLDQITYILKFLVVLLRNCCC